MYCGESARSAGTGHSQGLESAAAPAPARQTSNDFETRRGCTNRPEGSPAATGPLHTDAVQCVDLSIQPASSGRNAAYRARDGQFPQSASMPQSSSASPILLLPPI